MRKKKVVEVNEHRPLTQGEMDELVALYVAAKDRRESLNDAVKDLAAVSGIGPKPLRRTVIALTEDTADEVVAEDEEVAALLARYQRKQKPPTQGAGGVSAGDQSAFGDVGVSLTIGGKPVEMNSEAIARAMRVLQ